MIVTGTPWSFLHPRTLATAGVAALALASGASAQQRMFVVEQDDGAGPETMRIAMPDMHRLRTPDFVRDDLPDFERRLRLETAQLEAVTAHLEAYLERFEALALEILPASAHGPRFAAFSPVDGEAGLTFEFDGADELQPGSNVAIAISVGGEPGMIGEDIDIAAGGGDGAPGVFIAVDSADGEIPEEMRKRLEEQAAEMAEDMQRRMDAGEMVMPSPEERRERMAEHMARMEELSAAAERFETEKDVLRRSFEASVQGELVAEQFEHWPALERTLVRKKTLPTGQLSGESADLIAILESLEVDLEASTPVAEQALAYEMELHDALVRRNGFVAEANDKIDEALQNGDGLTALEMVERATALRTSVRDINKRYAETIASVLEAGQPEFQTRARKALWSRVYRPIRAEQAFEQARKLEGLSEEKLLNILELETVFRAELEQVNANLVRTIDREEPLERVRGMEMVADSMSGAAQPGMMQIGGDSPVRKAFDERRAFERRSMEQLYAILTPEQVATLPKIRSADESRPFVIQFGGPQDN